MRLFALRNSYLAYLRPFLAIGLLCAVGLLWGISLWGWEISTPSLAPGEIIRFPAQDVDIRYTLPTAETKRPTTVVRVGEDEATLSLGEAEREQIDSTHIRLREGPPALYVSTTNGESQLALLDQSSLSSSVGLVFAELGSEQFVRLPMEEMGLRIVRSGFDPDPIFLIEVLQADEESPVARIDLAKDAIQSLDVPGNSITLQFAQQPGVEVNIRHFPGDRLLMGALLLASIGALGFLRQPVHQLIQIGPWPHQRSVVVVQSNSQREVDNLTTWLTQEKVYKEG